MKHKDEHYRSFFGKDSNYFLAIKDRFDNGEKVVFNSYACIFGMGYMIYRKMYRFLLLIFTFLMVEVYLEQVFIQQFEIGLDKQRAIQLVSMVFWATVVGSVSNRFYMAQANRSISRVLKLDLPETETFERIQKAGGTSIIIPVCIVLSIIAIIMILNN